MKRLLLVRHAKSNWENPEWTDFERPLNKRGLRDAPFMADIVKQKLEAMDYVYASPAMRALTTAKAFCTALNYPEDKIHIDQSIYEKGPRYIISLVKNADDKIDTLAVFGHNPDMTSLFSYFTGDYCDNMPTCGCLCIDFDIDSWQQVEDQNGKIVFFEYPKLYFKRELGD